MRQSSAAFSKVQDYGRSKMIVMPAIYPIFNRLSLVNCSYFPDFVNLVPEKIILFKMFLLSWVRLKAGRRYGLILAISSVTFDSTRDPSVLCPVALSRSKTNVALVLQSFAVSAFYYRV